MNELEDHFEWQLLHNRIRLDTATPQEVDRFVFLDRSLRSQTRGHTWESSRYVPRTAHGVLPFVLQHYNGSRSIPPSKQLSALGPVMDGK